MSQQISTQNLLDMATEIAVSGKREKLSLSQINSFIEYAQQSRNIKLVSLFIIRQSQRGHFIETGKLMVKYIIQLNDINKAIELLGYVKWISESIQDVRINFNTKSFQELIEQIIQ